MSCHCILLCGITGTLPNVLYKLELNEFTICKTHNDHCKKLSSNV